MLRRQLERYGKWLIAIAVLVVIAVACAAYMLEKQRLRTPLQDRYTVEAEFMTASGLVPGLGQPVNVAGVKVGQVVSVDLVGGLVRVAMEIDPAELPRVNADAGATLVPNTPLKDMLIELDPGHEAAGPLPEGVEIEVAATESPLDSDDLTSALDADTREFFAILLAGTELGTRHRAGDLRGMLEALGPTATQVRSLSDALAARRVELKSLVHNLSLLAGAVGERDRELGALVDSADTVLGALASEDEALGESLERLPGVLADARSTLDETTPLVDELVPTLAALQPVADKLPEALEVTGPLISESVQLLDEKIRPLVRRAGPLTEQLVPPAEDLFEVTPALGDALEVLNVVGNELAYNPPGDNEGFLFWLAWFTHNINSVFGTEDAHSAVARGFGSITCDNFNQQPGYSELLTTLLGVVPTC